MSVQLDPDVLRTFVAIVDTGGFTPAARRVHRTQSAVSMQMKRLEESVGRLLFERDGRGVHLTADGDALLIYARRLLRLHDEAVSALTQPEMVGTVRLGTPDDYVDRFLPDILARFAQAYPRVQVEVLCEPSVYLRELLADHCIDLALITCAPGREAGEVLRHEPVVWATSERHCAHERDPLPLAVFQKGCFFRDWATAALDHTGRAYRIAYSSPSISGIFASVCAGLAVTVLARSVVPAHLRILSEDDGFPLLSSAMITLQRSGPPSAAGEALAQYVREGFRADDILSRSGTALAAAI